MVIVVQPLPVVVAAGVAAGVAGCSILGTGWRPRGVSLGLISTGNGGNAGCTPRTMHENVSTTSPRPLVVGLAGCTSSGKSTLCDAIVQRQGGPGNVAVVALDDFWLSTGRLPRLPDEWLANNPSMAKLKQHDTNVPAAIDWAAAKVKICEAISAATSDGTAVVVVEGFLLFSQPELITMLDRTVYLTVDGNEKHTLMMRKYRRSGHFGKPSYESRGITVQEYTTYWDECVIDRFHKYGVQRPPGTINLPCTMPTAEQVERIAVELPLPTPTCRQ